MKRRFYSLFTLLSFLSLLLLAGCDAAGPEQESEGGEPDFTNSFGMEFVRIEAGTFQMGDHAGVGQPNERPVHEVTISEDFYLGRFEVTQAQWETVMGANPSYFGECGGDCPVEEVAWNNAQDFIAALNDAEGTTTYRLPTEAEWEYATRAGTTTRWSFGDDESDLGEYAWYFDNSGRETHPVGQKAPNPWGLYDVHGNVSEWVQDRYDRDYYERSPSTDPQGPDTGSLRVLRGGGWGSIAGVTRSAIRLRNSSDRRFLIGLRILKEVR